MSKKHRYSRRRGKGIVVVLVVVALLALALLAFLLLKDSALPGIQKQPAASGAVSSKGAVPDPVSAEAKPVPAEIYTVPADGLASSVKYQASYTVSSEEAAAKEKLVVAAAGDAKLTNGELQVCYLSEVAACRNAGAEMPDFSLPLDTQRCPLGDGTLSWQHYFLERAVNAWAARQAMLAEAKQPQLITEEAYKPDATDTLHEKYLAPELPLHKFLYSDRDCYTPNERHQAWLDGLEDQLNTLAKEQGYADLSDYAGKLGTSAEAIVEAAKDYNMAYMYFTERSYAVTAKEAEPAEHPNKDCTVDFRHILLMPSGTGEEAWAACEHEAESLLKEIQKGRPAAIFAMTANSRSMDEGSRLNGGLYTDVHPGQMMKELDDWLFASDRAVGEPELIRSELGYHIVTLCAVNRNSNTAARKEDTRQQEKQDWTDLKLSGKTDYSTAALWVDTGAAAIGLQDVLYPDVAHERFPSPIVYLQQDYHNSPFGSKTIGLSGCGITTMGMLATYMTDTIQSPAMMGVRFPNYLVAGGTDGNIFINGVAELNFFCQAHVFDINEVIPALQNGQVAVSSQLKGHFTSKGHYLLLADYNEEDDSFVVRDSNIYNYASKKGHMIDKFTRDNINSGGANHYVMQPKVTRIPACTRCGGTFDDHGPVGLLREDYLCAKCSAALERRANFLELMYAV